VKYKKVEINFPRIIYSVYILITCNMHNCFALTCRKSKSKSNQNPTCLRYKYHQYFKYTYVVRVEIKYLFYIELFRNHVYLIYLFNSTIIQHLVFNFFLNTWSIFLNSQDFFSTYGVFCVHISFNIVYCP